MQQTVVRTFPNGHTSLKNLLSEGWKVVRVDPIKNENGRTCNDYILER